MNFTQLGMQSGRQSNTQPIHLQNPQAGVAGNNIQQQQQQQQQNLQKVNLQTAAGNLLGQMNIQSPNAGMKPNENPDKSPNQQMAAQPSINPQQQQNNHGLLLQQAQQSLQQQNIRNYQQNQHQSQGQLNKPMGQGLPKSPQQIPQGYPMSLQNLPFQPNPNQSAFLQQQQHQQQIGQKNNFPGQLMYQQQQQSHQQPKGNNFAGHPQQGMHFPTQQSQAHQAQQLLLQQQQQQKPVHPQLKTTNKIGSPASLAAANQMVMGIPGLTQKPLHPQQIPTTQFPTTQPSPQKNVPSPQQQNANQTVVGTVASLPPNTTSSPVQTQQSKPANQSPLQSQIIPSSSPPSLSVQTTPFLPTNTSISITKVPQEPAKESDKKPPVVKSPIPEMRPLSSPIRSTTTAPIPQSAQSKSTIRLATVSPQQRQRMNKNKIQQPKTPVKAPTPPAPVQPVSTPSLVPASVPAAIVPTPIVQEKKEEVKKVEPKKEEPPKIVEPSKQEPPKSNPEPPKIELPKVEPVKVETAAKPEVPKEDPVKVEEPIKAPEVKPIEEPKKPEMEEKKPEKKPVEEAESKAPVKAEKAEQKPKEPTKTPTTPKQPVKSAKTAPAKSQTPTKDKEEDREKPSTSGTSKVKRARTQVQPYQSPLPELQYITKISTQLANSDKKNSDEKLTIFYKNEYLALRNGENGFYLCQALQNVYKNKGKIRIRWMSEVKDSDKHKDKITYVMDYEDQQEFDCVLTTVEMHKLKSTKYFELPKTELTRIENILKKALDVESGVVPKPEVTEENPDGLDLSLYKDESQLDRKKGENGDDEDDEDYDASPKPKQNIKSSKKTVAVGNKKRTMARKSSGKIKYDEESSDSDDENLLEISKKAKTQVAEPTTPKEAKGVKRRAESTTSEPPKKVAKSTPATKSKAPVSKIEDPLEELQQEKGSEKKAAVKKAVLAKGKQEAPVKKAANAKAATPAKSSSTTSTATRATRSKK